MARFFGEWYFCQSRSSANFWNLMDELEIRCEVSPPHLASADRGEIARWLQQRIKTLIGVSARVVVGDADSIERTLVGKARRVIDKRPR